MANINNLNTPSIPKLEQRVRAVESGAPMNNGAVGRNGFEVYDNGTINVSSGNIIGAGTFSWQGSFSQSGTSILSGSTTIAGPTGITGQLTIQGSTSVTGPFTVTGVTKLDGKTDVGGAFTVTGVTKLGGDTDITGKLNVTGAMATKGTLSVEGVTTLKSNLNVTDGGKINVGGMQLEPAGGGQINFTGGAISRGSLGILINDVSRTELAAPSVRLTSGGGTLIAYSGGIQLGGLPTSSSAAPNLYIDANGRIWKTT